ncbi:TIGR02281 family clan AA aspartic protease [Phenylobacterium sp. LjRoot225]|uniref:TIGR02281 family clan AA aspartic protease n=1 Tax=Phenylobacterium sp. LjRoot225 TaxID=3342285 RepID=UPI003ECD2BEE
MPDFLRFAMVALVAAASAVGSAEAVVLLADYHPQALRAATVETAAAGSGVATTPAVRGSAVMKASDGHFWAEGDVNGTPVRFLVDTGATAVALTPEDAERLGIDLQRLRYGYTVVTAGGRARAASVKLTSVSVAGAKLADVDALVIEKGLDASLLGMSYLGRLSSFQATRQALFLHP